MDIETYRIVVDAASLLLISCCIIGVKGNGRYGWIVAFLWCLAYLLGDLK